MSPGIPSAPIGTDWRLYGDDPMAAARVSLSPAIALIVEAEGVRHDATRQNNITALPKRLCH